MIHARNFIDGTFCAPQSGAMIDVINPATGEVMGAIPDSSPADIDRAVAAAAKAFPVWSALAPAQRAAPLHKLADLIQRDAEDFARVESDNTGKPLSLARNVDIARAISNVRFFADAIAHSDTEKFENETSVSKIHRRALGVAACISHWNLPLYLFTWKIAPALAAGCTIVAKPSEITPLTAHMLAERVSEAGFPAGVLNIIHGRGHTAGSALVSHAQIACITFTGGTVTGQSIALAAAPTFKRVALELGGKNPAIIFADAATPDQLNATLDGVIKSTFTNQGQVCHCSSRILIQRAAWNTFVPALVKRAQALRVGDPLDATTDIGSLVSQQHLKKVAGAVELAVSEGGRILCGGARVSASQLPERVRAGAFFAPTLIENIAPTCRTNQEEIFGPVATLIPFDDEADAIQVANGTHFGLSASVWTTDSARAGRVAVQLDCGTVWINSWMVRDLRVPIGGMRASGLGREGGNEALRFFAEPVTVVRMK